MMEVYLMKSIDIRALFRNSKDYVGKEIVVEGWIRTNRSSKSFGFIELNDGTFFKNLQVVYEENLTDFKKISKFKKKLSIHFIFIDLYWFDI